MTLLVRDLALRTPVTVSADTAISQAEQLLIAREATEVFITDGQDRLLGSIPDNDFLNYRLLGGDGQGRSGTLMTQVAAWLSLDLELTAAARLLGGSRRGTLPVVNGDRLIGELSRSTILRICAEQADRLVLPDSPLQTAFPPAPKWMQFAHRWNTAVPVDRTMAR